MEYVLLFEGSDDVLANGVDKDSGFGWFGRQYLAFYNFMSFLEFGEVSQRRVAYPHILYVIISISIVALHSAFQSKYLSKAVAFSWRSCLS